MVGSRLAVGPATLEQVARAANVSRATASRVVNGDRRVADASRTAVEAAVRELAYTPNRAARALVTRRSESVAVVIPEPAGQLFGDPFFPRLLRGVSGELAAEGLQLVLLMPQDRFDERRVSRYLSGGHTDGVLLVSLHGDDPLPVDLQRQGIPAVVGGRPSAAGMTYVDVDNRDGAAMAVRHLIGMGRSGIATIAGPQDMAPGADRLAGYRDVLADVDGGIDDRRIEIADFTLDGGRAAMERLLASSTAIDAVFAASDLLALGALAALHAAGISVPAEVAVVGFDDSTLAASAIPALTSVRQPIEEMGREMVRLLMEEIRSPGRPPRRVILDTELVQRDSTVGAAVE
ncbi:MAG TPA: LacI family DNA-binding transcriptional regulator [Candidatus Limnocylindria bacterium]